MNYKEKYMKLKAILQIAEGIGLAVVWASIFIGWIVKGG